MAKRLIILVFTLLFVFSWASLLNAQESLIPVTIIRVSQPNIVVAEYCCGKETIRVRIKLAGIKPPLAYGGMTDLLKEELKKFVYMPGVTFDFALGHSKEESIWIGYLSYYCHCDEEEDEFAIINAELIAEGLAEVDPDTAGENMLNYLLGEQEKARQGKKGLWAMKEDISSSKSSNVECPGCVR